MKMAQTINKQCEVSNGRNHMNFSCLTIFYIIFGYLIAQGLTHNEHICNHQHPKAHEVRIFIII